MKWKSTGQRHNSIFWTVALNPKPRLRARWTSPIRMWQNGIWKLKTGDMRVTASVHAADSRITNVSLLIQVHLKSLNLDPFS